MALDQGLSRFVCCVQATEHLEEGLGSDGRCPCYRYEAGNLAEIEHILGDIYARFKDEDEKRRQKDRIDSATKTAVEKEREAWRKRFAGAESERHKLICIFVCIIAVFLIAYASSKEWMSVDTAISLTFVTMILVVGWYQFREAQKKSNECSRAIDEQNERKAEADERMRIRAHSISPPCVPADPRGRP
jgi:hypothetical protein